MNRADNIVYRLNRHEEFTYINEAWVTFAVANDAPGLVSDRVLGRSLWDFISDQTTRTLYKEILDQIHAGRSEMTFNFRCDAPASRRRMEMTIIKIPGGEVQFETRIIGEDERISQALLDRNTPRISEVLNICGWCKLVDVGARNWVEIEEAISALCLFERQSLPSLTHGMCEMCFATISKEIHKGHVF